MIFREISEGEFESFSLVCPVSSFTQSTAMLSRYKKQGREYYLVGVENEKRKLVLAALIVKIYQRAGQKIFSAPLGPLMDYQTSDPEILRFFTKSVKAFLKSRGGMVLQISPNIVARERDGDGGLIEGGVNNEQTNRLLQKSGFKYLGEYEQAKWTYILNLAPFYTENGKKLSEKQRETKLLMHFRQTCRLSIRYATERYHLKVRALKYEELPLFKKLVDEAGNYHGFASHSLAYYQEMYRAFSKNAQFLVAETTDKTPATAGKIPVAAAMFIRNGDEIIYLSSGSDRKYAKYCGSHLLQWHILRSALKAGCLKYNFWGTQPEFEPGVYKFKKGFRGQIEELLGCFALPLNFLGKAYLLRIKSQETRILE